MSDSSAIITAVVVAEVVPGAICLYAAYWAFSVRKALAGGMYRRHAFLLGGVSVLLAMAGFLTYSTNEVINALLSLFISALFIFAFAFIDSTVPLARRSDPLLRSILGWNRLRVALWIDMGALAIANTVPYFLPSNSEMGYILGNVLWPVFAIILFGASGTALVIGARRSRDPFLQRSLKWLGLCLLVLVLVFVADTLVSSLPGVTIFDFYYSYYALPSGILTIIAAYFLYRSARSLAPMSSFTQSESGQGPPVK